jgi:3-hydroxyacyl-[acyl-carrier-protein] dehydratase
MLDKAAIEAIIPHREEMLLIDQITALTPGESAVGLSIQAADRWFYKGHFPTYPVTPGVLILEMMAQTAAVCFLSLEENHGKIGFFAGINKARFRDQVRPGDVLTLSIKTKRILGSLVIVECEAHVKDTLVSEAELLLMVSSQ